MALENAERVVFVPGYGLAVARPSTPCGSSPSCWRATAWR